MRRGVKSRSDDDVSTPGPPLTKQRRRQLELAAKGRCIICGGRKKKENKVRCSTCMRRDARLRKARAKAGNDWEPVYIRSRPGIVRRKPRPYKHRPKPKKIIVKASKRGRIADPEEQLTAEQEERRRLELHNMSVVIRAGELRRMAALIQKEIQTTKSKATSGCFA